MKTAYKGFLTFLYGVSTLAVAMLAYRGLDYYLTATLERPRHVDYWILKPGGSLGLAYGIAGSLMMTAMMVYSVRKRFSGLRRLGRIRFWLDFHIYCGIFGPLLIVLHSSFKAGGLVALSFYSMILVALSGVAGRFLYAQIPRGHSGDELSLAEAKGLSHQQGRRLETEMQLSDQDLEALDRIASPGARRGLFRILLGLPVSRIVLRRGLNRFLRERRISPKRSLTPDFLATLRRRVLLQYRLHIWAEVRQLFYYWHVFHKPFAVIMYLFMAIHIAVAVTTGYAWSPS